MGARPCATYSLGPLGFLTRTVSYLNAVGISDTPPPLQDDEPPEEGEGDQEEADPDADVAAEKAGDLHSAPVVRLSTA